MPEPGQEPGGDAGRAENERAEKLRRLYSMLSGPRPPVLPESLSAARREAAAEMPGRADRPADSCAGPPAAPGTPASRRAPAGATGADAPGQKAAPGTPAGRREAVPGTPAAAHPAPGPAWSRRPGGQPASAGEAVDMVLAGLGWLATADVAGEPAGVQADCLRGLERALSVHTAARARVLAGFCAQSGYQDDGHGSPRTWLTWQTRITRPAASAALASMRRLAAHPAVAGALAEGVLSASWARQVTEWTDLLPDEARGDADTILLAAAAGGAELADLAALAEEMRKRLARPDRDGDGFGERSLRLDTTLGGAGRLDGDLTPRCAAALQAVLDTLGKKAGPEDARTTAQRHHDALEEACRRLLASGCLPDRAGQPAQLQLQITLDQLARGAGPGSAAGQQPEQPQPAPSPWPAAGPGDDCDASIAPIVTGRVNHDLLDRLAGLLAGQQDNETGSTMSPWAVSPCATGRCQRGDRRPGQDGAGVACGAACRGRAAARQVILAHAIDLLSGPGGLASLLRTGTLAGPAASISLPLDLGTPTETIPPHLRRAVTARDRHCRFPGCDQPPAATQVHHIRPRSKGGLTKLPNLLLLCSFHHLILVHRWGWVITLNPDGTVTATSPRGKVLHSHGPPAAA